MFTNKSAEAEEEQQVSLTSSNNQKSSAASAVSLLLLIFLRGFFSSAVLKTMDEPRQQQQHQAIEDEGFFDVMDMEDDEEWSTPVAKILRLPFDHSSWLHAQEILDAPSPRSRKIGDEARSIAARHIIDRLMESPSLLSRIHRVAPRLRSAVELLSKPDADYVYPKFKFVVNELRLKFPNVYNSITKNCGVRIPGDLKPSTILVSMAKSVVENDSHQQQQQSNNSARSSSSSQMSWGKFAALVGIAGALAVDSVESDYPEGVAEIVETFGVLVEQLLGEWILKEGGGWEGFIKLNVYKAALPPVPRTILICFIAIVIAAIFFLFFNTVANIAYPSDSLATLLLETCPLETDNNVCFNSFLLRINKDTLVM